MIYIRIELWPFGDESKKRLLGEAVIANDATGNASRGNYKAILRNSTKRVFRKGTVEDFPRKRLNVYDLLYRVLKNTVGERNEPKTKKPKTVKGVLTFQDGTPDVGVKGLVRLLQRKADAKDKE